jgi:hypothetical protein
MIVIIQCGKKKRKEASPAIAMYVGNLFVKMRDWAVSITTLDRIMILSAKHGLIKSTKVLEPYDIRMGEKGSITLTDLTEQVSFFGLGGSHVITCLSTDYDVMLRKTGLTYHNIAQGRSLGYLMQHLTRITRKK